MAYQGTIRKMKNRALIEEALDAHCASMCAYDWPDDQNHRRARISRDELIRRLTEKESKP